MIPANERKAAERQRRRDAGLVRVEVWVPPRAVALIKELAEFHAMGAAMDRLECDRAKLVSPPLTPESP